MTYLIVTGNSMEPTYHSGDMVLVRASESFQTGDVADDRRPQIGEVIHRIIGRDGQAYVLRATTTASWTATTRHETKFVGEAWLAIPRLETALKAAREPISLTILTVLSVAGIAGGDIDGDQPPHAEVRCSPTPPKRPTPASTTAVRQQRATRCFRA